MRLLFGLLLYVLLLSNCNCSSKRRKNKQDIKFRGQIPNDQFSGITSESSIADTMAKAASTVKYSIEEQVTDASSRTTEDSLLNSQRTALSADDGTLGSIMCSAIPKDILRYTVLSFWRGNLIDAYVCALSALQTRKDNGLLRAMLYYISQSRNAISTSIPKYSAPTMEASSLLQWELLGPFPVGKLEVDGDPAFDFVSHEDETNDNRPLDPGQYILSLNSSIIAYTEFTSGATTTWSTINARINNGQVDVKFPVQWNDLGQGLSNSAVFEFQAWARITTYAVANGQYQIQCIGTHTIYVRNENVTRIIIGDVYQSGQMSGYVDLKIGPVGIVVPIRGVGQAAFSCKLQLMKESSTAAVVVLGTAMIPELLELESSATAALLRHSDPLACLYGAGSALFSPATVKTTIGLMLSGVFSLIMQNTGMNPVSVEVQIQKVSRIVSATGAKLGVRQAIPLRRAMHTMGGAPTGAEASISVAPGQILSVPLEFYSDDER